MSSQPGLFFDVTVTSEVHDSNGRVIGQLDPDNRYHAHSVTDTHLVMRTPTGADAFVPLSSARVVEEVPVEPTTPDGQQSRWTLWAAGAIFLVVAAAGWFLLPTNKSTPTDAATDTIESTSDALATTNNGSEESATTQQPRDDEPGAALALAKRGEVEWQDGSVVGTSRDFVFIDSFGFPIDKSFGVVSKTTGEMVRLDTAADNTFPADILDRGHEIWISQYNDDDRTILILSVDCLCVTRTIPIGSRSASFIDEHEGLVWADDFNRSTPPTGSTISIIDPETEQIVKRIPVVEAGNTSSGLQATTAIGSRLFSSDSQRIWVFDRITQEQETTIELGGGSLSPVYDSSGTAIVTDLQLAMIHGVSDDLTVRSKSLAAADDDTFSFDYPTQLSRPAIDEENRLIWVTSPTERVLIAIESETFDEVHRIDLLGETGSPVVAYGHVWLVVDSHVRAFDAETGELVHQLPGQARSVQFVDDTLWVGTPGGFDLFDVQAN